MENNKIAELATAMGTTIEHLQSALVARVHVDMIEDLLWGFVWLALAVACVLASSYTYNKQKEPARKNEDWVIGTGLFCVLAVVMFLIFLACLGSAADCYISPEYMMLKYLQQR